MVSSQPTKSAPRSKNDLENRFQARTSPGSSRWPADRDCWKLRIADLKNGDAAPISNPQSEIVNPKSKQSILFWRKSLFDPDRLFNWLEPKSRFFWTRTFLVFSAGCILLAPFVLWTNQHDVAGSFASALRWETAVLVWLTLLTVTTLHEFAHGLTCKHYGGEVREIGFLLLFFMPGAYCNVSDAWLFPEKSKRLWVTLAGGYFALFVWALSVFVWPLTMPGSLVNSMAYVVLSVCGIQSFFNFNPFMKLDGYYLMSDLVEIPNLRQRSLMRLKATLRWMLWGAERPEHASRGRFLLGYGIACWLFSVTFLGLMLFAIGKVLGGRFGIVGVSMAAVLGLVAMRGLFGGISAGEVKTMIFKRHKRTVGWLLALGSLAAVLCFVKIEDRVGGTLEVRSTLRAELRAPVAGFLQQVNYDQGDRVSPGAPVVRLNIPDLSSRLAQKQAEINEAQAALKLLQAGTALAERDAQHNKVKTAKQWRDQARRDLERSQQVLKEDLLRLEQQIAQHKVEQDAAEDSLNRAKKLLDQNVLTEEEYRDARSAFEVRQAIWKQSQAERQTRRAQGTQTAEAELARRDKELADAQTQLKLLEAETRPEEIAAAQARLNRLEEEARYLERLQEQLLVFSPFSGLLTTEHLKEKAGQYFEQGDLICTVEDPTVLEVRLTVSEQDLSRVRLGQTVQLKTRALPFETFTARVDHIAPAADVGEAQSSVTICCRLSNAPQSLLPGMTGYARIETGRRTIGRIGLDRSLRFLRTEFWW